MQTILDDLKLNKRIFQRCLPILVILSLIVLTVVFWWLKLVGITLAGSAFCGYEEHSHTEECICQTQICTVQETAVCTLEEHMHTDTCYERILICTQEHTHTNECHESVLICTVPEHLHGEACTGIVHSHTDECYQTTYICGYEEHIHTASCYSDPSADLETPDDWEASMSDAVLTGETAKDIVKIAKTQLGYTESTLNFVLDENGTRRGYTRYGEWYGNPHGNWSAMYVSFCLYYAGLDSDIAPYHSGTQGMMLYWTESGLFVPASGYTPQTGDLLFLDANADGNCTQVGIVSEVGTDVTAIHGNSNDRVESVTYEFSDSRILGYGSIRRIIGNNLSERDRARIENVNAEIAALPTEGEVLQQMEILDPDTEEFEDWYRRLSLNVMTAYVYYEDLSADLRTLVEDTAKLDALSWTWQTSTMSNQIEGSINVYQVNASSYALVTIAFGSTVETAMGTELDYAWWDAYIIDKNEIGYYVSGVNREGGTPKLSLGPTTEDGFVLLVWQGSSEKNNLIDVTVGQSVSVTPTDFYKTVQSGTDLPIGTVTFTSSPMTGEGNSSINQEKLTTVESADTRNLIEVNLFDYGENINTLFSSDSKYPGFQQHGGTVSITSDELQQYSFNFGDNITVDLAAGLTGISGNPGINATNENGANYPISDAIYPELIEQYPALADGTSLQYLFTDNIYTTKMNTKSINGLFQYDPVTGSYYFDSRNNHAQFEASDDTFTLYNQRITSNYIMYPFGNFMPFNDIMDDTTQASTIDRSYFQRIAASALYKYNAGSGVPYLQLYQAMTDFVSLMDANVDWSGKDVLSAYFALNGLEVPEKDDLLTELYNIDYDEASDFFFGMSMELEFMQPKDGYTGIDGKQPMVYEFTGDDDVWIYLDGKLFLDLSGIHRHVGGNIDFTTGIVSYYALDTSTGVISTTPYKTLTFAEILGTTDGLNEAGTFENYTEHTLKLFYIERGAGSSVCRMNFNLPLLHKNRISVSKQLDQLTTDTLGDPQFSFQICKENGEDLLIGADTEYRVYDQNGNTIATRKTDGNGIFTLRNGETAVFSNVPENAGLYFVRELINESITAQYGSVTVNGTAATTNESEVLIDRDTFHSFDSTMKDISDGNTSFSFINGIDQSKNGSLKISKVLKKSSEELPEQEFTFLLYIDETPIPVGTPYLLTKSDGIQEPGAITEAGKITFYSGESVYFADILAGSLIQLKEEASENYIVTYTSENTVLSKDSSGWISGRIPADTAADILITNEKEGAVLHVPVQKSLLYPDQTEKNYTFLLDEIISAADHSKIENGTHLRYTVSMTDTTADFAFSLSYPESFAPGSYYYMITEENASLQNGMDTNFYIIEVTVTKTDGTLSAVITDILKNTDQTVDSVEFINRNVRSLTVNKTVEQTVDNWTAFQFTVTASASGIPLSGTFPCTASNGQTEITFTDGTACTYLKHGESITVYGLPYGTEWSVSETEEDAFFTECNADDEQRQAGNTVNGVLNGDQTAFFYNIGGYALPSTGSYADLLMIFVGSTMMLFSLICGCVLRHKRERRKK